MERRVFVEVYHNVDLVCLIQMCLLMNASIRLLYVHAMPTILGPDLCNDILAKSLVMTIFLSLVYVVSYDIMLVMTIFLSNR